MKNRAPPTHNDKFNFGFTSHDRRIPFTEKRDLLFGLNWKYVEGYDFTGSPQFTGPIKLNVRQTGSKR